ncbi:MAG: hypothetical protein J7501_10885 [Bdellovibrio sp.]|nr:hypothetical protein [Bdellovibrio sp.]
MSTLKGPNKIIQNQQGLISVDFIFSLVLCAGLCIVLFSVTFTLSMAEIGQYIAYSTSRAHAAGHIDQDKQEEMGRNKFANLMANGVIKPLFSQTGSGSWFKLSNLDIRGAGVNGKTFNSEYKYQEDRLPQTGVRLDFGSNLLNMRIAFLGSTSEDGEALTAKITAFMLREPTQQECWDLQVKKRYDAIINLDSRYGVLAGKTKNQYVPMEDNGC